jgi:4-amino-4-deoxy-L-arabinose transferase-like glycosyltransferase
MQPSPTARWTVVTVAAMVLISGILSYWEASAESPTFDEPLHAAAGYLIRWSHDYRLDVEDPALFPLLSTLPQRADDLHIEPNDPRLNLLLHDHDRQWAIVIQMMFRTVRPDGESVYSGIGYINRARLVFTVIDMMLGALIAWWAFRLSGSTGALIAAGLFAFDPNFIAHGALVKNDVVVALLLVWLMFATWRFGQRATLGQFVSIAAACALVVNVKFTGLLFGFVLATALLIRALQSSPWPVLGWTLNSRISRFFFAVGVCLVVALFSWMSIWTVYGWRSSIAPDPSVQFDRAAFIHEAKLRQSALHPTQTEPMTPEQVELLPLAPTGRAIVWMLDHHVLPDAWLYGLFYTWTTSLYRQAFLLGMHSPTGWWYYFPLAMLFKTPLAVLATIAILGARWVVRRVQDRHLPRVSWDGLCLWLTIAMYGVMVMRTNLNIGLRHVLPIYPFIYLLIAVGLSQWIKTRGGWTRWVAGSAVILAAVESLACWPHEITFFNLACGGPGNGIRLLSDSNLDWGQDLPQLAQWQHDNPRQRLYLAYFGSVDPHDYNIDYVNISGGYPFSDLPIDSMNLPGVFAISASFLQGTYNGPELADRLRYLKTRQPLAILDRTIYLYRWDPAAFEAFMQRSRQP